MTPEKFQIGREELDSYIARLLYEYDCVIVPQLGGFVTNYAPAKVENGIARPPRKDLRFNRNLTKNDGLLVGTIAEVNDMPFEEADRELKSVVDSCLSVLEKGHKVEFKKIGVLYFDRDQILRFSPSEEVNFLKDSIGFTDFAVPGRLALVDEESEVWGGEEAVDTPSPSHSRRPSYTGGIYRVAAATLLPFIGLSVYIGLKTDFQSPATMNPADLWPFPTNSPDSAPVYTPRQDEPSAANASAAEAEETNFPSNTALFPFSFERNAVDENGVWVDLNASIERPTVDAAKSEATTTEAASISDTAPETADEVTVGGLYHIIAGCFEERENAEEYIADLRSMGYPAAVLDHHKNLYRVRLKSYSRYQTALGELQDFREQESFSGVWMLKKRVP